MASISSLAEDIIILPPRRFGCEQVETSVIITILMMEGGRGWKGYRSSDRCRFTCSTCNCRPSKIATSSKSKCVKPLTSSKEWRLFLYNCGSFLQLDTKEGRLHRYHSTIPPRTERIQTPFFSPSNTNQQPYPGTINEQNYWL